MDEKSSCPVCLKEGHANNLVFVNYKRDEAFLTCASRNCMYFATDTNGGLGKYKFDLNLKRYVLMPPADEQKFFIENKQLPPQSEINTMPQTTAGSVSSFDYIMDSGDEMNGISEVMVSSPVDHSGEIDFFLNAWSSQPQ